MAYDVLSTTELENFVKRHLVSTVDTLSMLQGILPYGTVEPSFEE